MKRVTRGALVFVGLFACGAPAPRGLTVAPAAPAASTPRREGDDPSRATPTALVRAWVAAVERGDWPRVIALHAPRDEPPPSEVPAAVRAKLQATARKLDRALGPAEPVFVPVDAVLAEPDHLEWYFCGEKPPGRMWRSPCAVSVVGAPGRYAIYDITDDAD